MGRPRGSYTGHGKTKLARLRQARDVSLDKAAEWIGLTRSTLWRLEQGQIKSPRLGWLVNAALFYGVALDEVIEDDWLRWQFPQSRYGDDLDFSRYWGERAQNKPTKLKRQPGAPVKLSRSAKRQPPE